MFALGMAGTAVASQVVVTATDGPPNCVLAEVSTEHPAAPQQQQQQPMLETAGSTALQSADSAGSYGDRSATNAPNHQPQSHHSHLMASAAAAQLLAVPSSSVDISTDEDGLDVAGSGRLFDDDEDDDGAADDSGEYRMGTAGLNKSRYRGVSYDKKKRKWRVQIKVASLGKSGVSVGYYDTEHAAARAYDRAAIGLLGRDNANIVTNFPLEDYDNEEVPDLIGKSREDVKAALKTERAKLQTPRRRSSNKQRSSKYVGVGATNRKNQWQARIVVGGKITHLGYYESEEQAARVYDRVSLSLHNSNAHTNFAKSDYSPEQLREFQGLNREGLQRALGVKPMERSGNAVAAAATAANGDAAATASTAGGRSGSGRKRRAPGKYGEVEDQDPAEAHMEETDASALAAPAADAEAAPAAPGSSGSPTVTAAGMAPPASKRARNGLLHTLLAADQGLGLDEQGLMDFGFGGGNPGGLGFDELVGDMGALCGSNVVRLQTGAGAGMSRLATGNAASMLGASPTQQRSQASGMTGGMPTTPAPQARQGVARAQRARLVAAAGRRSSLLGAAGLDPAGMGLDTMGLRRCLPQQGNGWGVNKSPSVLYEAGLLGVHEDAALDFLLHGEVPPAGWSAGYGAASSYLDGLMPCELSMSALAKVGVGYDDPSDTKIMDEFLAIVSQAGM